MSTPASGIKEVDGDRVIAASRRPDGTIRKERKVRPGFVPQEDVTRYSNEKVEASKVPKGYVPGMVLKSAPPTASDSAPKSKSAKKNAARAAKKAAEKESGEGAGLGSQSSAPAPAPAPSKEAPVPTAPACFSSTTADAEKKLKNLRKKLRQIEELQDRADKGEELVAEQKEKLAGRKKVEDDISELEAAVKKLSV
ncbi:hypothetical protein HK097_007500 [Rhizophlyctis rosea]|uniref:WIBG Mago-binding domain-containing protein n=1 Tax=Rhizophlyctis rosea TaxID=64517 RepID=A0AAD5SJK7_9FUNG|nr:hypothetical protein HK097_007500 [Rhizophlyctis rosea]